MKFRNTIFTILIIFISTTVSSGQVIEKIVKKNISEVCNCLSEIDDENISFGLIFKIDSCSPLTKKDSIKIDESGDMDVYYDIMINELYTNCAVFSTKTDKSDESAPLYSSENIEDRVIGQYSFSYGHSPSAGGVHLFVQPQNRYVVISFGEFRAGTWEIKSGKYLYLTPDKYDYPFSVYGRYNSNIGDSTRTTFVGDNFSYETLIHFGKINENLPSLMPIHNKDVNCLSYSYVGKTISDTFNEISLAYNRTYRQSENKKVDIYTFKSTKAFNDFIIYEYTNTLEKAPIKVAIGDDKLAFEKDEVAERHPLPEIDSEDAAIISEFAKATDIAQHIYYNSDYSQFTTETLKSEHYYLNQNLDAYISVRKYESGVCDTLWVNKFELLPNTTQQKKQFKIDETPFIYSVCD